MYYKKYKSENLYLSPINSNDYKIFTKWINDQSLSSGLGVFYMNMDENSEKAFLENMENNSNMHAFALVREIDDQLIGFYSLELINPIANRYVVGGFIGEKSNRGKGYGSEALNLITKYGFEILNAHTIIAKVFSFNLASLKMVSKANYQQVGKFNQAYFYNGKYHDEILFEYLAQDYFTSF